MDAILWASFFAEAACKKTLQMLKKCLCLKQIKTEILQLKEQTASTCFVYHIERQNETDDNKIYEMWKRRRAQVSIRNGINYQSLKLFQLRIFAHWDNFDTMLFLVACKVNMLRDLFLEL